MTIAIAIFIASHCCHPCYQLAIKRKLWNAIVNGEPDNSFQVLELDSMLVCVAHTDDLISIHTMYGIFRIEDSTLIAQLPIHVAVITSAGVYIDRMTLNDAHRPNSLLKIEMSRIRQRFRFVHSRHTTDI